MNFKGDEGRYLGLDGTDDGYFHDLLAAAAQLGDVVTVCHTENIELVNRIRRRFQQEGRRHAARLVPVEAADHGKRRTSCAPPTSPSSSARGSTFPTCPRA